MSEDNEMVKVHITEALTSKKVISMIENYPSLKTITCSQSIYDRIPDKYIDALKQLDIDVRVEYNQGAKRKYPKELIDDVISQKREGLTPKEIAVNLDLSVKKTYYILEKYSGVKLDNYRRKYSSEDKNKIRSLRKEGFKPKDISDMMDIPVRTVYYILNNR